jgi:hypothetical protein
MEVGTRRVALSLPAGYVEDGETPDQTARRKLRDVFLARNARRTSDAGGAGHDDLEEIEVLTLPLDEALTALARGEIAQLSSAAALALAAVALSSAR